MTLAPLQLQSAVKQHGLFLTSDLQPVTPRAGQWFVEAFIEIDPTIDYVREGGLVEYLGEQSFLIGDDIVRRHLIAEEGDEEGRFVYGDALILQK